MHDCWRSGVKPGSLSGMTFSRTRQQRLAHVCNFRAVGEPDSRRFAATVMRYDVLDDYDTMFGPESFLESMAQRMPRVVWGHDWTDPIGRWVTYENKVDDEGVRLDLVGEFDDFAAVPRARQAYAQLRSGTIDQFSVGFFPEDAEIVLRDGREVIRFTRARLDEVSLVLVGAVPGTQLLAMRQPPIKVRANDLVIPKDTAAALILDLHSGKIDLADALQAIKVAQVEPPAEEPPVQPEPPVEEPPVDPPVVEEPPVEPPVVEEPPVDLFSTGEFADVEMLVDSW